MGNRTLNYGMGLQQVDLDKLHALPIAQHIQSWNNFLGTGCAFNPPGYPGYQLQSEEAWSHTHDMIYFIVDDQGTLRQLSVNEYPHEQLRDLWIKVPEDHEYTKSWEAAVYLHWNTAWGDGSGKLLNANQWDFHRWREDDDLSNYGAVLYIRQWYPEHQPRTDFIPGHPDCIAAAEKRAREKQS